MSDMERVEGEIVETSSSDQLQDMQNEINDLRQIIKDQKAEIEHIRTDNSVLKETIVRMQIKNVGLME